MTQLKLKLKVSRKVSNMEIPFGTGEGVPDPLKIP